MINKLLVQENLDAEESAQLFASFQNFPLEKQAAILALFTAKRESIEEIEAALQYFGQYSTKITHDVDLIDIVGTGGDGQNTFNISTAASLLVASCGVFVAKHGGRRSSSNSGSSDLIEALHISTPTEAAEVIDQLHQHHFVYLKAAAFHPALQYYGALRKALGIPTLFNILGPLLNPMRPRRQLLGVYRPDLLFKIAAILNKQSIQKAMVVHSEEGLDEISVSSNTCVIEIQDGQQKEYVLNPEDYGIQKAPLSEIQGQSAVENAEIIDALFSGHEQGAKRDVLLLNAAAGLYLAGQAASIKEGLEQAGQSIDSGRAFHYLNRLKEAK